MSIRSAPPLSAGIKLGPAAALAACLFAAACANPAAPGQAGPAPGGRTVNVALPGDLLSAPADKPGTLLADTFFRFCVGAFPAMQDLAAVRLSPGESLAPMPPDRVRQFLKADPGRGWVFRTADRSYVVTIEAPPYNACAVRSFYQAVPSYALPYHLLIRTWAATNDRGEFKRQQGLSGHVPGGGEAKLDSFQLPARNGHPTENYIEVVTRYPSGEIEVRLVRQIPDATVGSRV